MERMIRLLKFFIIVCFTFGLLFSCATKESETPERAGLPNVLVILIEELAFETMPVYGNEQARVPNMHKLSQESWVFKRAYATQPVCGPSRGSILTGKYPHRGPLFYNNAWSEIVGGTNGRYIADPDIVKQVVPFTEYMPRDTIKTCYVGKWHIGPERTHPIQYFDEYWSIVHKFRESDDEPHTSYNAWMQEKGFTPDRPDGTFGYKRMVNMAREFSRLTFMDEKAKDFMSRNRDVPWLMFFSPHEVHTPNSGPYDDLIAPREIQLDSAHYKMPDADSPVRHRIRASKWSKGLNEYQRKTELARYYGKTYDVDKSVGTLIEHLKATGQYDNTAIIFTSDHGSMVNRQGFETKMVMFDHSSRVPFMIKMPNQKGQYIIEDPISLIDLLPTVFDLQQIQMPEAFDGKSLLPVMEGQTDPSPVVIQWHPIHPSKWEGTFGNSEVRNQVSEEVFQNAISQQIRCWVDPSGFKLVLPEAGKDKCQLYDTKNDPLELHNLYYTGKYSNKIKELESKLLNWQKKTQDQTVLTLLKN